MITSSTRVTGLFGHPVSHSRSPQMHNAAFAHLGLDYAYLAFDVEPEQIGAAVQSIRTLGLCGVNVTIPHKVAVIPYLDALSEEAKLIGAVNTIVNDNGRLTGYNTDGIGYISALREETGCEVKGKTVLVLGAGGAARAVAAQMALGQAQCLLIAARSADKAQELANHLAGLVPARGISLQEVSLYSEQADLVVNTTPVGLYPQTEGVPMDPALLQAHQMVSDLIYNPRETRFLREAKRRGCVVSGGLGMFIHQGAHAFQLWTGIPAPTDVMRETVESYL